MILLQSVSKLSSTYTILNHQNFENHEIIMNFGWYWDEAKTLHNVELGEMQMNDSGPT